jgi:hypothetical protein
MSAPLEDADRANNSPPKEEGGPPAVVFVSVEEKRFWCETYTKGYEALLRATSQPMPDGYLRERLRMCGVLADVAVMYYRQRLPVSATTAKPRSKKNRH